MAYATLKTVLERLAPFVKEEVNLLLHAKDEVKSLSSKLQKIHQVLADAERKRVTDPKIRSWLQKLNEIAYEIDDALDEWEAENIKLQLEEAEEKEKEEEAASRSSHPWLKVSSFFEFVCSYFKHTVERRNIALDIKSINGKLDSIDQEIKNEFKFIPDIGRVVSQDFKRIETSSFVDVSDIFGRDMEKDDLMSKLLSESSSQGEDKIRIFSIVGAGGMGKTALAQLVFNEIKNRNEFKPIWVSVSEPYDVNKIAQTILDLLKIRYSKNFGLEKLLNSIKDSISGERFFLVLDDVWNENADKWIPLKISLESGHTGSRILVTTRKVTVAKVMGSNHIHPLKKLSDLDCWSILSHIAFHNGRECDSKMLETGKKIAKKCNGMPLAAKTMGGLLRSKTTLQQWENVLNSNVWEIAEVKKNIFPLLEFSYNELEPAIKCCFSYCAVFPKGSEIEVDDLIRIWMALGFLSSSEKTMELQGHEYFDDLAMRTFFQDFGKSRLNTTICKMHEFVHNFAHFQTKSECLTVGEVDGQNIHRLFLTRFGDNAIDVSLYPKLRSFFFDRRNPTVPQNSFCRLKRVRVLSLISFDLEEIPKEIGNLIHIRYLDVSCSFSLKELPETVCNLYNLQTLDIRHCYALSGLPEGIHKLKNLRHLLNDETGDDFEYPQGTEKLVNLRTLDKYSSNKWGYLKDLNQLQGSLTITVTNGDLDEIEVEKADLKNKKDLRQLTLLVEVSGLVLNVIENIQPPPNLEYLGFRGLKLPKWTTTLTRLRKLDFESLNFTSSYLLPPLEKLPHLEELGVGIVQTLEHVGNELLGIMNDHETSSVVPFAIFPKLKILVFAGCRNWKEWEDISHEEEENNNMIIMPCLQELTISFCRALKSLPHRLLRKALSSSLELLEIIGCDNLYKRYNRETGDDWDKVSHISKVLIDIPETGDDWYELSYISTEDDSDEVSSN